jgi:hypothetical protein
MKYTITIIAFIILFSQTASAEILHPAIGQIQASGTTADDEFIVLQNQTGQSIDVGNWSIQYKSVSGSTYYKKNFTKGSTITANGNYIVCGKDYASACDMKHSSFSLSSSGGTVFLVSNQILLTSTDTAAIVDQKSYSAADEAAPTPTLPSPLGGEGAPTPRQPETMLITINEFMPTPIDSKEWIELYNSTGYAVDLNGWTLADGTGKNFITLDGLILPTKFKLIELASSHLNNTGDLVILRDANKREIDSVAYGDWDSGTTNAPIGNDGTAIARIGDGRDTGADGSDFAITATPTPGTANIITAITTNDERLTTNVKTISSTSAKLTKTDTQWLVDLLSKQSDEIAKLLKADNIIIINNLNIGSTVTEPIKTATIAAAKNNTAATTPAKTTAVAKTAVIKTTNSSEGMVIVPAGTVGKDICVVREADRSVEIRLPKDLKIFPVAGDMIKTSGAWSTAKTLTLPRLLVSKTTAFAITDHNDPPQPLNVPMSRTSEHLGEIISTIGTIVEKQPTRLRLADGDASLLIKTNFEAAKGDKLAATGLIVKNGVDLFLTVIDANALSIIKPPPQAAPSLAKKALPYGLAALPAVMLSTAVYFGKRMKKKKNNYEG